MGTACTMLRGMKQIWRPWSPELMCIRVGVVFDLDLGGWEGFLEVGEARELTFCLGESDKRCRLGAGCLPTPLLCWF